MIDETFPPCFFCEHPMMRVAPSDPPLFVHCQVCEACGAQSIVPLGYADKVDVNFCFDGSLLRVVTTGEG